jgi:pyruvate dehydrogenase E2 component (dihydrolipoamide acetyltransferase)
VSPPGRPKGEQEPERDSAKGSVTTRTVEIRVPQLGEGMREARIVAILCAAGSTVARGTPIYVVETDKSTVELESPAAGTLVEWRVTEDDVVPIDTPVALLATDDAIAQPARPAIPPRTRDYARRRGIGDAVLQSIPARSGKLMPDDIDAYTRGTGGADSQVGYRDRKVERGQRALIFRMRRSTQLVIPGTIAMAVAWTGLQARRTIAGAGRRASAFQVLSHAAATTAMTHTRFRSIMQDDDTVREFDHVNVGIALARPDDRLVMAVVRNAGAMSLREYVAACDASMRGALRDGDQAVDDMPMLLSYLGHLGVLDALPSLVGPASSVLFLGAPDGNGMAKVVLTFDHRLVNGDGAARFLRDVVRTVSSSEPGA